MSEAMLQRRQGVHMRVARALAALVVLALLLFAVPWVILRWGAWEQVRALVEEPALFLLPDNGQTVLAILTVAGAIFWVVLVWSVLVEAVIAIRERSRTPSQGTRSGWLLVPRRLVRPLVSAVFALAMAGGSLPAVADDPGGADPIQVAAPSWGTTESGYESSGGGGYEPSGAGGYRPSITGDYQPSGAGEDKPTTSATGVPTIADDPEIYVVAPGDSLWSIAEQVYGDGQQWPRIAEENQDLVLGSPGLIRVGWQLRIPASEQQIEQQPAQPDCQPDQTVTVVPGDSLWAIAEHQMGDPLRWTELAEANQDLIGDPDLIMPGWELAIPCSSTAVSSAGSDSPATVAAADADAAIDRSSEPAIVMDSEPAAAGPTRADSGETAISGRSEAESSESAMLDPSETAGPGGDGSVEPTLANPGDAAEPAETGSPEPTSGPSSADQTDPEQLDHNDFGTISRLVGASVVVAGGITLMVRRRRLSQLRARPVGRRIMHPGPQARQLEAALSAAGSQAGATDPVTRLDGLFTALDPGEAYGDVFEAVVPAAVPGLGANDPWGEAGQEGQAEWTGQSGESGPVGQVGESGQGGQIGESGQIEEVWDTGQTGYAEPIGAAGHAEPMEPAGQSGLAGQIAREGQAGRTDQTRPIWVPGFELCLGVDEHGEAVHVDIGGPKPFLVAARWSDDLAEVMAGVTMNLAAQEWFSQVDLHVVTDRDLFATFDSLELHPRFEDAMDCLKLVIADRRTFIGHDAWSELKTDPNRGEAWRPVIYCFADPVREPQFQELVECLSGSDVGVAVAVARVLWDPAQVLDLVGGVLEVESTERAVIHPEGTPVQPLRLRASQPLSELLTTTISQTTTPAWWSSPDPSDPANPSDLLNPLDLSDPSDPSGLSDPANSSGLSDSAHSSAPLNSLALSDPANPAVASYTPNPQNPSSGGTPATVTPSVERGTAMISVQSRHQVTGVPSAITYSHPVLKLLGPIVLEGAQGTPPPRAERACMEYCGWLLEHPGTTATAMAQGLLVAEGTRRSNMSRLRAWLGHDGDGKSYLPEAYSGRIWLDAAVSSDWQRMCLLIAPGVETAPTEPLIQALELVRGAPLADAAPGQWHWAEELRTDMVSVIRDIGVIATRRCVAERDIARARWAASRALVAAPEDEALLCARVLTEHAAGNRMEVERLVTWIARNARNLGIDLLPETVVTLQQVLGTRSPAPAG